MNYDINNYNRHEIQQEYVDYVVGSMDFIEAKTVLKNYMMREKDSLSNSELEKEIRLLEPSILYNSFAQHFVELWEEGYQNA